MTYNYIQYRVESPKVSHKSLSQVGSTKIKYINLKELSIYSTYNSNIIGENYIDS